MEVNPDGGYLLNGLPLEACPYEEFLSRVETGDLVFFSGRGIVSTLYRLSNSSGFSHLGMVVVKELTEEDEEAEGKKSADNKKKNNKGKRRILLFESTIESHVEDERDKTVKTGTMLVDLEHKVQRYYGDVVWRKVLGKRDPEELKRLDEFIEETRDVPYELSKWELFLSLFGGNQKENFSSFFCSELVAEAYKRMNWIDKDDVRLSNNYLNCFFSREMDQRIRLRSDLTFGGEYLLRQPISKDLSEKDYFIQNGCAPISKELLSSKEFLKIQVNSIQGIQKRVLEMEELKLDDEDKEDLECYVRFHYGLPPADVFTVETGVEKYNLPEQVIIWDETLFFPQFTTKGALIRIELMNKNPLKDDLLGYNIVSLEDLPLCQPLNLQLSLHGAILQLSFERSTKPNHK